MTVDESDHTPRIRWGRCQRVAAAADLPVQSFLGIVAPDLSPVFFGEPGEREQIGGSLIQMDGGVGESSSLELVDDTPVPSPHRVGIGLSFQELNYHLCFIGRTPWSFLNFALHRRSGVMGRSKGLTPIALATADATAAPMG